MSANGFVSMLSLADLYFVTEHQVGSGTKYSYRFQWSTQAVKAAADGVYEPNIYEYIDEVNDDGSLEIDREYYHRKTSYDYIKANQYDNTDTADSFIFRLYDKNTNALVNEIFTTEKSVDIFLDGKKEYLWEVTALKNGQVIKTSQRSYFCTDDEIPGYGYTDDWTLTEHLKFSSKNHLCKNSTFTDSLQMVSIKSYETSSADFIACGTVPWADIQTAYDTAKAQGYLFPTSNLYGTYFPTTENCLFSRGIYVYNNGKWDYVAYNTEAVLGTYRETGDFFFLDDELATSNISQSLYRYNAANGQIETVATAPTAIKDVSPDGTHYQSLDGVYRISDNCKIINLNPLDHYGEYYLFNEAMVHIYSLFNHVQKTDDLDEGQAGTVNVDYTFYTGPTAGQVVSIPLYSSNSLPAEIESDELYSLRIGDYIIYRLYLVNEEYWQTGSGFAQGTIIVHKIQNGTVTEVLHEVISNDTAFYSLFLNEEGDLVLDYNGTVLLEGVVPTPAFSGNQNGLKWRKKDLNDQEQIVTVSNSSGTITLQVDPEVHGVKFYGMQEGNYYCTQRKINASSVNGAVFTSMPENQNAQEYLAESDQKAELFFARSFHQWQFGYVARHEHDNSIEEVLLFGKNKFKDIFAGSEDASILVLTDDANGDALIRKDFYTDIPETAHYHTDRFSNINEIRAGAGDDLIDMTGYSGYYDEITIRGGAGDDVIWAQNGDNDLFGDEGNDRIAGGSDFDLIAGGAGNDTLYSRGGGDIFAFCENWGQDTVVIENFESVTLWFASGSESNWDASNRVYRDGSNSVTVIDGAYATIELKFGNDGSSQYYDMLSVGAFESATSKKVFEDPASGYLA